MFKNRKYIIKIGSVSKVLSLKRYFWSGRLGWKWNRQYFRSMKIDLLWQLNPHVAILGQTGTGKSNACKKLLTEIANKNISLLIFDAHNEYVGMAETLHAKAYDAADASINVLDLEGDGEEKAGEVSEMLRRILRLGYRQYNELYRLLAYTYRVCESMGKAPNMDQLLFAIKVFKKNALRSELGTLNALESRIALLHTSRHHNYIDVQKVMQSNSIFALSRIHTAEAQTLFVESFLRRIYQRMLISDKRKLPSLYIVIEEAEKLSGSKMLARLTAEGRKYGIGIVAISQRAKALDREIRSNAGLIITFYQREPEELNYLANIVSGGNEYNRFLEVKKALRNLGRGYAVVLQSRQEPAIVRFDLISTKQRDLSFEIASIAKGAVSGNVMRTQLLGIGFGGEEINAKTSQMIAKGELHGYFVPAGRQSGMWFATAPRNSVEHYVMLKAISEHLNETGTRNKIYDSAYMPDIVAFSKGQKIAVEYETGKKDIAETKEMLERRKERYAKTLVIVNDAYMEHYKCMPIDGINLICASDFLSKGPALF